MRLVGQTAPRTSSETCTVDSLIREIESLAVLVLTRQSKDSNRGGETWEAIADWRHSAACARMTFVMSVNNCGWKSEGSCWAGSCELKRHS